MTTMSAHDYDKSRVLFPSFLVNCQDVIKSVKEEESRARMTCRWFKLVCSRPWVKYSNPSII